MLKPKFKSKGSVYKVKTFRTLQSKYSRDIRAIDFISHDSIAEVKFELDLKEKDPIGKEFDLIANELDLIKLGVFLWKDHQLPIEEETWILNVVGRDINIPTYTRGSRKAVIPKIELTEKDLISLISIINILSEQQNKVKDIRQAIWLFGRSCLALLYRDVLLDSAIGLEGLLVPNPGDSAYRFGLHGAITLANKGEKIGDLFKRLKEIYNKRSRAAHGDNVDNIRDLAFYSREYLAKAIFNICMLCHKGLLPSNNIDEKLQDLLIEKSDLISDALKKDFEIIL